MSGVISAAMSRISNMWSMKMHLAAGSYAIRFTAFQLLDAVRSRRGYSPGYKARLMPPFYG
jgi:hypothetical protein